jgi:hypothetical protein
MGTIRFLIIMVILLGWLPLVAWALGGYSSFILSLEIELAIIGLPIIVFIIGWISVGGTFNDYINS